MKTSLYVFNPYPAIGGGDTTLKRFINSINLNKFNVIYFSLTKAQKFSKKIKFIKLKSKSTFFSFFEIKEFILRDNSEKKIFFSMQYFANIPVLIFLNKIRNLKTFLYEINHPNELNYSENIKQFFKKKIIKFLVKKIYYRADVVAANCKELSKDLSNIINRKVETIYNPCFFKINFKRKKKLKKKINILNVARFEYQKDHFTLLKAIKYSKYKSKIRLNLVGFGSKENLIRDFIYKNKINCKIHKNKKKLSQYYKSNDLFVLSSLYEGLPTVMIEAASYCLPLVSSNFKSGSREILKNGKFGHLFQIKNYLSLSKILNNFYERPEIFYEKEKLCRKSLNKFSNEKNIKKFNKLLIKLSY